MVNEHTNFQIKESGLQLHKDFPILGLSPDGINVYDCCGTSYKMTFKEGMPNIMESQILTKHFPYLNRNGSQEQEVIYPWPSQILNESNNLPCEHSGIRNR